MFILRFDKGEELFEAMVRFAEEKDIRAGFFTGLGAAESMSLAHYNISKKEYEMGEHEEEVEILSLVGNLSIFDRRRTIHMHATFGRKDFSVFGGHLFTLNVSTTCEVMFTSFSVGIARVKDEETGLHILSPLI